MADWYTVLRMLSNFVGQDRFLKGVSIYLKKHLYANTTTKDLWMGISESTGRANRLLLYRFHTDRS